MGEALADFPEAREVVEDGGDYVPLARLGLELFIVTSRGLTFSRVTLKTSSE